jgi:MFS transporter, ACS family, aldohexuronate transporter
VTGPPREKPNTPDTVAVVPLALPTGRWMVLALALGVQIATSLVASALPVLLPFVKAEFHLSFAEAGLLANFAFVGGFLAIALIGWAVDILGDRFVLVAAGLVAGIAALLCAAASVFPFFLAGLIVMGVGIMMPTPSGSIAVRSAFPRVLRGTVMSIRQTGVPIGGFLAALLLPWVSIYAGWRWAFGLAGAISIAFAIVTLAVYRTPPHTYPTHGSGGNPFSALNRDLGIAASSGVFLVASQICLLTYLVLYLIGERHMAITSAAAFLALAQLAGASGRILWGVVSDRVLHGRRRPAILLAALTGALASATLAILPSNTPLPLLGIVILTCAMGAVGWNGVQILLFSELAKPGNEGRAVGLGLMIQQPGILIGPFLFGTVVDKTGSFRLGWLLVAAFLASAALLIVVGRETGREADSRSGM